MFGLMRPQNCCTTENKNLNYLYHRKHYCGTCKAIGKGFDQKSRLMLNFDTVFLSELLSHLNQENLNHWDSNLQTVNTCFSMPSNSVPFSLEYAANVSVLLGALKIDDHIKDQHRFRWHLAKQFYHKSFQKATNQFKNWGIDTIYIYNCISKQVEREKSSLIFDDLEITLTHYAEPTAAITAYLFEEGGQRLKNPTPLYDLGYEFGKLMYILDAFEDYEQDIFKQQFNPLAIYWNNKTHLSYEQLETVRSILLKLEARIQAKIKALPLTIDIQTIYQNRLTSNLALRLYKERTIPKTTTERIRLRWAYAKEFANQLSCQSPSWFRQLNYYVLVFAVFANPQTTTYLPQEGKLEIAGWGLLVTSLLASIGIIGVVRKNRKEKRQQKRKEKRLKRLAKKLKKLFWSKHGCCSECCSGCCESCCDGCCENCCETICESESPLFWILVIGAVVLTVALIFLILFLAGVI
ncbi:DUF5685 family protein [Aureispira anguillae]|uniref:DUF5685 family protein n=1 Tax=Aureispira anguillae TaxID=2864201 RepID=A0A915YHV8_9BACT|nr:DUF5685 family protein [Aureispira anguillae]BDS13294.1 DUF5685 family protein [Aureispira anguillae]